MATTTVTATYLDPSNQPCTGRVVFRLVAATYQTGLDAIFPQVPATAVLNGSGAISIELEPTSGASAAFDADTMTYQVWEHINGAERSPYYVDIPTSASVDLGALVTYDTPPFFVRELVSPDLSTFGYLLEEDAAAQYWEVVNVTGRGVIGNGIADDTAAIQAILDEFSGSGAVLLFPAGTYRTTATLTLYDYITIKGAGSGDVGGTKFSYDTDDGTPFAKTAQANYLSNLGLEDFLVVGPVDPGDTGTGDCFELYALVNNSAVKRIGIQRFRRDGFRIGPQTGSPGDNTACGNVTFEQVFAVSVGGYAFRIDGLVNATWMMPDINSCVGGAFHFLNGASNQANINIHGLWWEGNRAWTSEQPILLTDMDGQCVNLYGPNFGGPVTGTDVIKIAGSTGAKVNLYGATGFTFDNWINDTVGDGSVVFSSRINHTMGQSSTEQLVVQGPSPLFDMYDSTGSGDRRRWRVSNDGGSTLRVEARYDDQTLHYTPVSFSSADGSLAVNEQLNIVKFWKQTVTTQTYSGGLLTIPLQSGNVHRMELTANVTATGFTAPTAGMLITLIWVQDATGGRTVLAPAVVKFAGGAAPTWSTVALSANVLTVFYDGTDYWEVSRSLGVRA